MKAFILAAGLGTRLKPLTDTKPKALIELNGITMLEILINRLKQAGFNEFIINVHHFSQQIIDYLNAKGNFGVKISISNEKKLLLDTGGGLKKASWFFSHGQPFLVHNVDIFTDLDLAKLYSQHFKSDALITLAVQKRETSRYLLFDSGKILCGWENIKTKEKIITREQKGTLEKLAYSGIHIADPKIFYLMPDKSVFSLIELFLKLAPQQQITYFDHSDSVFLDLGKMKTLKSAEKYLSDLQQEGES